MAPELRSVQWVFCGFFFAFLPRFLGDFRAALICFCYHYSSPNSSLAGSAGRENFTGLKIGFTGGNHSFLYFVLQNSLNMLKHYIFSLMPLEKLGLKHTTVSKLYLIMDIATYRLNQPRAQCSENHLKCMAISYQWPHRPKCSDTGYIYNLQLPCLRFSNSPVSS